MGKPPEESGESDSDHDNEDDENFLIRPKAKFFNSKKQLVKFIRKDVERISETGFGSIECSGNSYDQTSCEYIAELIRERSS